MRELESLTYLIGELVAVEIDDVKHIEYSKETKEHNGFIIVMKDGRRYTLQITDNNWKITNNRE